MATYYYNAQATGANDGSSKADAFTTYAAFVAAMTSDGDVGYHRAASQESPGSTTTYTFQARVAVFCIDFDTDEITDPNDVGGYVGSGVSITVTALAGRAVYISHFRTLLTVTGSARSLTLGTSTSGCAIYIGKLRLESSTSNNNVYFGSNNASAEGYVNIGEFTWDRGAAGDRIIGQGAKAVISKLVLSGATTESSGVITCERAGSTIEVDSFNSVLASGSTIVGNCLASPGTVKFRNAKFPTNYILLATQTSGVPSSGEVFAYDSAVGDTHINFHYANAFGEVRVDTGKYADDNIGDENLSWKITTTAKVTRYTPFAVPPISRRHRTTGSVTPWIAVAREDSADPFTNADVWADFGAKETDGCVCITTKSDKAGDLATPADQTTDATTTWTNLGGTNWKGKIGEQSFTVAEVGHIIGQVYCGKPNAEFRLDPQVRI